MSLVFAYFVLQSIPIWEPLRNISSIYCHYYLHYSCKSYKQWNWLKLAVEIHNMCFWTLKSSGLPDACEQLNLGLLKAEYLCDQQNHIVLPGPLIMSRKLRIIFFIKKSKLLSTVSVDGFIWSNSLDFVTRTMLVIWCHSTWHCFINLLHRNKSTGLILSCSLFLLSLLSDWFWQIPH